MHPAILLPQSDVVVQVRIQPGALYGPPEGLLMQENGTCSHDDPVDTVFFNVVGDQLLARIRAHELIAPRNDDVGKCPERFRDQITAHGIADVAATIADINADARFLRRNVGSDLALTPLFLPFRVSQA